MKIIYFWKVYDPSKQEEQQQQKFPFAPPPTWWPAISYPKRIIVKTDHAFLCLRSAMVQSILRLGVYYCSPNFVETY